MWSANAVTISLSAILLLVAAGPAGGGDAVSVGPGPGVVLPNNENPPCDGRLLLNFDGTAEDGYAWRTGGVVPPDWGAFAEGFEATGVVCGAAVFLTQIGAYAGQTMDIYLYETDHETPPNPGRVIGATIGVDIGAPGWWPAISRHEIDTDDVPVNGGFFLGSWGNWPGSLNAWFWAADLHGPTGQPRTHIRPGTGWPSGWQHTGAVWTPPAHNLGIGVYLTDIIPAGETSWGGVKGLYR